MKRNLSFVLVLAMVVVMFGGICAYAASYTPGTVIDFDTVSVSGLESGVSIINDGAYDNVINWNTRAKNFILDFSSGSSSDVLCKGSHILSFDARLAENNVLYMYYCDYNPNTNSFETQRAYTALRKNNFMASSDNGAKWSSVVGAAYTNDVWAHYDIIFHFDDSYADIYIDGEYKSEMALDSNADYVMNGFNKIFFVGSNDPSTAAMNLSMDNVVYRPFSNTASVNFKLNDKAFDVYFSEIQGSVTAADFTLAKTPVGGTAAENVGFEYNKLTPTKGRVIPESLENGYTYTITYKGGTTALNNNIPETSDTKIIKQTVIDNEHNFEDGVTGSFGTATADKVLIEDEQYRGKVLKINGNIDWYYKLSKGLDGGKYIFSYDTKNSGSWGKMRLRFYSDQQYKWYNAFAIEGKGMGSNFSDKLVAFGDSVIGTDEWHRIDIVLDIDNAKATAYLDGSEKGTFLLTTPSDGSGAYDGSFWGSMMSYNGTNGTEYFDNIRTRNISDKYGVSVSADGNLVYVDFNETTTGLTKDNFAVTKSANSLSQNAENVGFELVYQNGTRAVLRLNESVAAGTKYTVKLNDVNSFLGNSPKKTEISYINVNETVSSINDDMSSYTTENVWTDSRWSTSAEGKNNNAASSVTAADGTVTLVGDDTNEKLLKYDLSSLNLSEGIVEIETVLNVTHSSSETGSKALAYYRIADGNGTEFNLGEVHINGFMAAASESADSKSVYTNKDTAFAFGTDTKIRTVINMGTKQISTYCGDKTLVSAKYPLNVSGSNYANSIETIPTLSFITRPGYGVNLNIKNIKVTKTVKPSVTGDIMFRDVTGAVNGVTNVSSATNAMIIEFSNGLLNNELGGTAVVRDSSSNVVQSIGEYNADEKTYTLTFDKLLGAEKNYTVELSGITDSDGAVYTSVDGGFKTGAAVKLVSNEDIIRTSNGADVTVKGVNTGEDAESYYVIYTGYKGNRLVTMDYAIWNLDSDFTDYIKIFSFMDAELKDCDKINSYVWKSFEKITPVTNSVTKDNL